jgi:YidC/Oxa1 family membrane protein insertase
MNFDRNTIIGFIILALLFFGFFIYNSKQQLAYQKEKARQDSITNAAKPKPNPAAVKIDSVKADSFQKQISGGDFQQYANGTEQLTTVDNGVLKLTFTNKGGQLKTVELKKFKGTDSSLVKLGSTGFDKIDYKIIPSSGGGTADITAFYFTGGQVANNADGSYTVSYQLPSTGKSITHQFVVKPNNYMIDFNVQIDGVNQLLGSNTLNLTWQNKAVQQQKDLSYERQQSQIAYRVDGDYNDKNIFSSNSKEFDKPLNWVAVKQQFFNSALIAKNNFSNGRIDWNAPSGDNIKPEDKKTVVAATAILKIQVPGNSNKADIPMALYYGPTDYKMLKQYGNDMENMVNLGSGIYAFVKYINRWIVLPVFDLFSKLTSNFGIVILLLTLFIRLMISPLTYSSYLSGAKMKVLRPEIEQLKAKYGKDQQQISVEQMKLFREAGVNPLGGCIPAILQIPIFFALYSFFQF